MKNQEIKLKEVSRCIGTHQRKESETEVCTCGETDPYFKN